MNDLIHEQSERVNTEELDLWTVPATACAITSRRVIDCPLVNSIANSSALEFRYSHQRAFRRQWSYSPALLSWPRNTRVDWQR